MSDNKTTPSNLLIARMADLAREIGEMEPQRPSSRGAGERALYAYRTQ